MPDVISSSLQITNMETGSNANTWGDVLDANDSRLETAIAGVAAISGLVGGSRTLTDDENRNAILSLTGTLTADQTIVVRTATKWWHVRNNTSGSFTVTVKTSAGIGVVVARGVDTMVFCDGTNVLSLSALDFMSGMSTAIDNRMLKTDGTSGRSIQQTGITVDDSNNISGVNDLGIGGAATVTGNALIGGFVGKAATSGLTIPSGTTAQRDGTDIQIRYNSELNQLEAYYNSAWQPIGFSPGDVKLWFTETAPTGWLELDGVDKSRSAHAALFAVWGTTFGVGNGLTTFGIPDMRGQFVRGWDHGAGTDPDAASRTDRGDGTTGDRVGTGQADEFKEHTHSGKFAILGIFNDGGSGGASRITADQTVGNTGGNETRGKNVAAMFCVKF